MAPFQSPHVWLSTSQQPPAQLGQEARPAALAQQMFSQMPQLSGGPPLSEEGPADRWGAGYFSTPNPVAPLPNSSLGPTGLRRIT